MSILHLPHRAQRYLNAYGWLLAQHLRICPLAFLTFQAAAVIGRIGNVAGLVGSAYLLAHMVTMSHSGTHSLGLGLQITGGELRAGLVLAPVLVLLAAALCQRWAASLLGRVMSRMVPALADDYLTRIAAGGGGLPKEGRSINIIYQTLIRIESRFPLLVQHIVVLAVVVVASIAVVGPLLVLAAIFGLGLFMGASLLFRQQQSHALDDELDRLDRRRAQLIKSINQSYAKRSDDPALADHRRELVGEFASAIQNRFFWRWRFTERSRVSGLMAQAGMAGLLLLYVASLDSVNASDLARLVAIFMIMRFTFATVQGINANALSMARDYRALVSLREGRIFYDAAARRPDDFDEVARMG